MSVKCTRCGDKVFHNELVKAGNHNFHDACFKCMNCNKRMTLGKTNDTPDGKVLCSVCYNSKHGPKVYGFGSTSGEGGSGLDVSKQSEKIEDFKKTPEVKSTVSKPTTTDNKLYTNKFSNSNLCVSCGKKVFENERVSAHSYVFHDTCFKCMNCNKRMTLGKTNDTPEGKVFCNVCYNSKHGPKVYGFTSGGEGGSGLDVSRQSEKKEEKDQTKGSDLEALEKLAALKKKGIITEEEFQAKKKQILGL